MLQHRHFYLRWLCLGVIFAVAGLIAAGWLMPGPAPVYAAGVASSKDSPTAGEEMPGIVGSWLVTTTVVKQDTIFPSLLTFTGDGILLADEPPSPFETTGHGAWEATGDDGANFTFLALIGSESGPLSATIKVVGSLEYDAQADTWQGPFKVWVTDPEGNEMLADDGTFAATRIAVESLAMEAEEPAQVAAALKPGDKIGAMAVSKGPDPFDLSVAPIAAFCNTNPVIEAGATIATPGEYTVECAMPPLDRLMIGFGWVGINAERRDIEWNALDTELYVNGQAVDQPAFGSLDADVPVTGVPGLEASEVVTQALRIWNVALENLQPGPLTLRWVFHVSEELYDGVITVPAGTYDITFEVTVDESLAVEQGAPEPVVLVQQTAEVFDAFNAAVNAHDVDKALGFFADDAVASFPNQPEPNRYAGQDELRNWLATDAANNIHVETSDAKTSGDTITATARLTLADLPPDMVLEGRVEVTVRDGKIQTFSYTLSDETIERLKALEAQ